MKRNVIASGKVRSVWVTETGWWAEETDSYIDIEHSERRKEIGVHLCVNPELGKMTVEFDGPTGFESYALKDMEEVARSGDSDLCICFGTINRWPRCLVDVSDLRKFLDENRGVYQ